MQNSYTAFTLGGNEGLSILQFGFDKSKDK